MAVNYFLKLDGIPGESQDPSHVGQIGVLSWSWGMSRAAPTGTTNPKPNVSEFSIFKDVDLASAPLMRACLGGTVIKSGLFVGAKVGSDFPNSPFLQMNFQQLRVTSVQDSGSSEVPSESVSFSFGIVTFTYTPTDPAGTPGMPKAYTYNIGQNKLT